MDTVSHICMGAATGLVVSTIANSTGVDVNTSSVVALSIAANCFPDIDVLFKLKSNNAYIANHRGKSHSIVFALLWVSILTLIGYYFARTHIEVYFIVSILGVSLHLFTDLLNGYGVALLWPFYQKWIALGITYTFDAILIVLHIIAFIAIFIFNTNVLTTFAITYSILILYLLIAFIVHFHFKFRLIKKYGNYKRLILQARVQPFTWKYVYETNDKEFYMGLIIRNKIDQIRFEKRLEVLSNDLEKILYQDKDYKAFIDFTPIYNYKIRHQRDGVLEIKFYDLRYLMVRKNQQFYTFNCFIQIKDSKVITSYLAFTINEENAYKNFEKVKEKQGIN
ncbi:metal-dependent hydrolase [Mycoplasma sp. P36-A1]|uniref:metal-dependent hydrolase n=1 Tax=Mycoplasma sp. P36-A1 TaxID=3252900 RepID=UPI003C2B8A02